MALLIAMVVSTLAHLGLPHALVYNLSSHAKRDEALENAISVCLRFLPCNLLIIFFIYAVLYLISQAQWVTLLSPFLLLASCFLCIFTLAHTLFLNLMAGLQNFRWRNIISILPPTLSVISAFFLWLARMPVTPHFLIGISILSFSTTVLMALLYIWSQYHPNVSWQFPVAWKKDYLFFGLKFYAALIAQTLNYRLDALLLGVLLGVREVGLYSTGVSMTELLLLIPSAMNFVLYPKVSSLSGENRNKTSELALGSSLYLVACGCVALVFLLPHVIPLLFGQAFRPSVSAAFWLLPGMLAMTVVKVSSHIVAGYGRPEYSTYITLTGLIATVPLDLWLIPRFGIAGAAIASSIAYTLAALTGFVLYSRLRKVSYGDVMRNLLLEPMLWMRRRLMA